MANSRQIPESADMMFMERRVRMGKRRAFTLIELLVVIAVIAVLMAILMPALNRAREQGKRAVCLSTLKQLQLSWILYADDNDGKLVNGSAGGYNDADRHPNEHPWVGKVWADDYQSGNQLPEIQQEEAIRDGALWPYAQELKLYSCPTSFRGELLSFGIVHSMNGNPPPGTFLGSGPRQPKSVDGIQLWVKNRNRIYRPTPAQRAVFIDEGWATPYSYAVYYDRETWWDDPTVRHGNGTNLGFADGHAEYWKWKGTDTLEIGQGADRTKAAAQAPTTEAGYMDLYRLQKATWGRLGYAPTHKF
jgi:prepilin-type N-terminal cleavage/methylation domain-containing protein/prepilin-type processing-associated H-X9-DG protein